MNLESQRKIKIVTGKLGYEMLDLAMRVELLMFQLGCIKSNITKKHYERMVLMIGSSDSEQHELVSKMIQQLLNKKMKK